MSWCVQSFEHLDICSSLGFRHSSFAMAELSTGPWKLRWCLLLTQCRRQPVRPDILVAVQRREALDARGHSDGGEAWMARRGKWSAVVHGGAYGNAGRHFVVYEPADALAQMRFDGIVGGVILAG